MIDDYCRRFNQSRGASEMTAARNSQNLVARLHTNAHLKKDTYATWEEAADEIERLRAELDTTRLDERARIVAWLRAQNTTANLELEDDLAKEIKAGEHLK